MHVGAKSAVRLSCFCDATTLLLVLLPPTLVMVLLVLPLPLPMLLACWLRAGIGRYPVRGNHAQRRLILGLHLRLPLHLYLLLLLW